MNKSIPEKKEMYLWNKNALLVLLAIEHVYKRTRNGYEKACILKGLQFRQTLRSEIAHRRKEITHFRVVDNGPTYIDTYRYVLEDFICMYVYVYMCEKEIP